MSLTASLIGIGRSVVRMLVEYPISWVALCLALVGIGAGVRAGFDLVAARAGPPYPSAPEIVRAMDRFPRDGWLGWAVVLGFLQVWHLFRPVGTLVFLLVVALGLALLAGQWWRGGRRIAWAWLPLWALLAVWMVSDGTFRSLAIDTGLYHLGAVRWANEYAIMPGLGLLHSRFAFNNSSFLWAALCDHWPGGFDRAAAGVEILFFFSLAHALLGVRRVVVAASVRLRDLFDAFSLVPLLVVVLEDYRYDGPLSPDLLLFPLGLMVVSELMGFLDRPTAAHALPVLLLSACGVAVKVSFAGAALAAWGVVLVIARRNRLAWVWAGMVAVGIGGVWCARSVILSGWPVFLLAVGGAPVSWRMPADEMVALRDLIAAWARAPGGRAFQVGSWLREMAGHRFAVVAPMLVFAVSVGVGWVRRRQARVWVALAVPAAGLAWWLIAAPLPRYASSLFWALALVSLAEATAGLAPARLRWAVGLVLVGLGARLIDPWTYLANRANGPPSIPYAELDIQTTDSGLAVLVPVKGEQCWDAPLPHAPRLDPRLALRDPDDFSAGFRLAETP